MVTNSPNEHKKISKKELSYIEESLKGESETMVRELCAVSLGLTNDTKSFMMSFLFDIKFVLIFRVDQHFHFF